VGFVLHCNPSVGLYTSRYLLATDSPPPLHRLLLRFPRSPLFTCFECAFVIFIFCLAGIDREKTGLVLLEDSAGPGFLTLLDFQLHFLPALIYLPPALFFFLPFVPPLNHVAYYPFLPLVLGSLKIFGSYRILFDTLLFSTFNPGLFGLGPSDLQFPGQFVPRTRPFIPPTRPTKFLSESSDIAILGINLSCTSGSERYLSRFLIRH
jgi:hypothetical protein